MKTFFIALVLGIFIGSIVTAYFTDPEAFNELVTKTSEKTGVDAEKVDEFKEKAGDLIEKGAEKSIELAKDGVEASVGLLVMTKLRNNDAVTAKTISVKVDQGIATLEGSVPSKEIYDLVVETTLNTKGVKRVDARLLKIVPTAE